MTSGEERELIELWMRASEGVADSAQLARLNEQIEAQPAARELVVRLAGQQGWLAWHASNHNLSDAVKSLADETLADAARGSARTARSPGSKQTIVPHWLLPAIAACLLGVFVGRQLDSVRQPDSPGDGLTVQATMVSATGCVWGPGNTFGSLSPSHISGGEALQLLEGLAELRVGAGQDDVRLQMEGPVSVVLTASGAASTSYGKIIVKTGRLPSRAYAVETSFGRVLVGPESEIGLINFGSTAEVHCFRGSGEVESPWLRSNEQDLAANEPLSAGQALRFKDIGGALLQPERSISEESRFTPQVSMATDFLAVTPEYVRTIAAARPVAYWRFEQAPQGGVPNEMGSAYRGLVKGQVGWAGPEGNRAVELGLSAMPGSIRASESWDAVLAGDFSIELWMKPSHHHLGSMVGFVGEFDPALRRNRHGILLEACGPSNPWLRVNQVRFLHRSELTADPSDGVSCFSGKPYEPRRWQHLVAERDGDKLLLYVDGELAHEAVDGSPTPRGLQLVIGQLYTETVERFFIGQLDEVAIYDRALSSEEAARHSRLLRPQEKEQSLKQHRSNLSRLNTPTPVLTSLASVLN
jgi:hypothetical protein